MLDIHVNSKEDPFWKLFLVIFISLLGYPIEYSWQCPKCLTWDWGSIYRLTHTKINLHLNKCIKHKEL